MARTTDRPVHVSLAEIARIAGVGRAAVSNWRRRYEDFPGPVGGTDASPQFDLSEIEAWLRDRGKLREDDAGLDRLWPLFESLRERDAMGEAIAEVGAWALEKQGREVPAGRLLLSSTQRRAAEEAVRVAQREGGAETFTFLLNRWLGSHVRQVTSTPEPLADLMAQLASLITEEGCWSGHGSVGILDPACGVGALLDAAQRSRPDGTSLRLLGQDSDPVIADLAARRLALSVPRKKRGRKDSVSIDVRSADSLRGDAHGTGMADVVLCAPPTNERDWGHDELAADPRWVHGHPPRTESELAWVQHALAALRPGGVAVLLLPPGVASRKAGRRIRAALLRSGVLRALVALPTGAAAPHGVALHLWVLHSPEKGASSVNSGVLFIDTTAAEPDPEWSTITATVRGAVMAHAGGDELPVEAKAVPVVELLDEHTDLTPAHHVPAATTVRVEHLRRSWSRFESLLDDLGQLSGMLSEFPALTDDGSRHGAAKARTTVGELLSAGALTLRGGRRPAGPQVREGAPPPGELPFLTLADVQHGGDPGAWLPASGLTTDAADEGVVMTAPGDLVVAASARAFNAWVDDRAPTALGSQLFALTVDPASLDPWFLAGCLRAPGNARRAGTHASTASRIDVRRLRVPLLPLAEQRRLGEGFRQLARFESTLREAGTVGGRLVEATGGRLTGAPLTG